MSLSDDEAAAIAARDPENPPLTDEQFRRAQAGRIARLAREVTGLSQRAFAERYHINVARLRDLEQGRRAPDEALLSLLKVIIREPDLVKQAIDEPLGEIAAV
ncbi:helix-turn-helix domain-containing protein [Salinarimonas sp. NSM]|uniref:helix-turn-helix domain-containing protein n=1 Tax=Salinarimonas sp. NSM TaxID=3458003 RepID=UPI0040372115